MPEYHDTTIQPYSPEQLFDLVADVERYPQFVPGYRRVTTRPKAGDELEVDQTVQFGPAPLRFTSIATLRRPHHISISATDGPFSRPSVEWRFDSEDASGCRVDFRAAYEMDAGPLASILNGWFADTSGRILRSFLHRARQIYG